MKAEFINPLIEACQSILSSMANISTTVGQPFVRTSPSNEGGIGICLGVTGKIRGQVLFTMKREVACQIASAMMMSKVEELDEVSRSAVSELTNMIMGRTAAILFDAGIKIDITPPAFLLGENMIYLGTRNVKTFCIPFVLENGGAIEAAVFVQADDE